MTRTNVGSPVSTPVRVGLVGAGGIGSFHGESLAQRVPGAILAAVADPAQETAERVASSLGCPYATPDPAELLKEPSIQAVVIAAPASVHADLIEAAAGAGKAVFCEKPMALTLADADRAIDAASTAGVTLQVGFNRRFAPDFRAAHDLAVSGDVGQPQLLRSLTRDPRLEDPSIVKPWTIFFETLIHDFDALRWLNPGAEAVEVYAVSDALVRPDWKDRGQASDTTRLNTDLFLDAYTAELAHFVDCVRTGAKPESTGEDAREALAIALAAIRSVEDGRPVRLDELEGR